MAYGTDTIFCIHKNQVPAGSKATYTNAVCGYRPLEDDPYRVQITVGGDILIYPGNPNTPAASLLDSKIILNSKIPTPGAQFSCADIKDYFLNNPMARYGYMKIPLRWFPQEIIDQYKIMYLVDKDGFAYVNIRKGMKGLKQAACIYFYCLVKLMKPRGYHPLHSNPVIWCHKTLPTKFALRVDNFGIKYTNPAHAHHLVDTLKKYFTIYIDWVGVN